MIVCRQLFSFVAAMVAVIFLVGTSGGVTAAAASTGDSSEHGDATCWGGSIASGVYSNLKIAGACNADAGPVRVKDDLTVLSGGSLIATFGGSDVTVRGDVEVKTDGVLVLGCEPINQICSNDPDQKVGSFFTRDRVGGDLRGNNALAVIVHLTVIGHDVSLNGGGGGVSCASPVPAIASPPYGDFEDDVIGGDLKINGWQSCWLGVFRDAIARNVQFNDNVTADPDGNELGTNSILGDLRCARNTPSPQLGDSGGSLNNVFGHAFGQCNNPNLVR